jgi:hypothetical protein
MASVKTFYTREHPHWPTTTEEALDEISELNDLLDAGGWSKGQRDWIYQRRAKLTRYVNDPQYRIFTGGVNKAVETIEKNKAEGNKHD